MRPMIDKVIRSILNANEKDKEKMIKNKTLLIDLSS